MVCVFTRSVTDELAGLVSRIDESLETYADESLAAFVVLMTDQPADAVDGLKQLAEREEVSQVPLTIFKQISGPDGYYINDEYEVTVVMWNEGVVKANHGFQQASLTDSEIEAVMGSVRTLTEL